jgi:SAM-dependent methyltransferase
VTAEARYDGHAEWHDETFSAKRNEEEESFLREYVGAGNGEICVDVACGTGRYGRILADAGYRVVGFGPLGYRRGYREERLRRLTDALARSVPPGAASVEPDGPHVAICVGLNRDLQAV